MKKSMAILVFIVLVITLVSCGSGTEAYSRTGLNLGTVITVTIYGGNGEVTLDRIFDEIYRLESILSKSIETSDISKINQAAGETPVALQPETITVLVESLRFYEISNGYFNIAIGPLVELWGIGTENAAVPDENDILNALSKVDLRDLAIRGETAGLLEKGMSLDTGGIAKGYIADRVAEIAKAEGCSGALINLGGNVLTVGKKPDGTKWKIGIQDPFEPTGEYMQVVHVDEMSVVTSGPYERNFQENGITYHHILDPFTGYPVANDIAGVTVICEKSIDGDGLSTTVFALGAEAGIAIIENLDNTECYIILDDGTILMSSGFREYLALK
jgi:thiamine biosynthesis lipoprotein